MNDGRAIDRRMTPSELRRFLAKVVRTRAGCWNWIGYLDAKGYGQFRWDSRMHWAHRVSHATFNEPVPDGLEVHHECGNPSCVNPDHLSLLTKSENVSEARRRNGGDIPI